MNKRLVTILQYVFFLGLGIFLVWWSAKGIDEKGWADIRQSLKGARYWLLLPSLAILFLAHWWRAMRWRILMEPLGFTPKKSNTFFAVMIGYLANLAVPRLGEILKCTVLARYEKVPVNKLVGTMIAERAFDMIALLTVFFLAIVTQVNIIGKYFNELIDRRQSSFSEGYGTVLVIAGIIIFILGIWFILKKFSHISIIHNVKKMLHGIWQGLTSLRYVKHKGQFFLYSFLIWGMYYFATYVGFYALADTEQYGWKEAFSVLAFGSVGMIITQGGIGAYQLMVQKTMALYGLNDNIGWAFGWITWIPQTLIILLLGLISFALLPYYNKTSNAQPGNNQPEDLPA